MTSEEKVLFLFAQTCTVLSKSAPDSQMSAIKARVMGPGTQVSAHFDDVYAVLEQKLNEKLNA